MMIIIIHYDDHYHIYIYISLNFTKHPSFGHGKFLYHQTGPTGSHQGMAQRIGAAGMAWDLAGWAWKKKGRKYPKVIKEKKAPLKTGFSRVFLCFSSSSASRFRRSSVRGKWLSVWFSGFLRSPGEVHHFWDVFRSKRVAVCGPCKYSMQVVYPAFGIFWWLI